MFKRESIVLLSSRCGVGAKLQAMHPTTERLFKAAAEVAGLSKPSQIAVALGESQQTLKNWEARGASQRGLLRACELWGLSPSWVRDGEGPMRVASVQTPVAHGMSLDEFTVPTLNREELLSAKTPSQFAYELTDDAMGAFGRAGTLVLFKAIENADQAKPGAGVLFKDKHGALHVRRKRQGKALGHWVASAPNDAYASFDSEADGLTVLGVWSGVLNRGLEDA